MIVIPQSLIRANLDYQRASLLIEDGFRRKRVGTLHSSNRQVFDYGEAPVLGVMPASNERFISAKVATVNYGNSIHGLDSHQGAVLLFARPSGVLKAVVDATELTAIRTTSVSCLVIRLLASRLNDFKKVAIIGAGVQAYHHIAMFSDCYGIKEYVVISRSAQRVKNLTSALNCEVRIEHRENGASLQDCQVIVVATHANELALHLEQVRSSAVILAMGACRPSAQEIATNILDNCIFVADCKSACIESSGEGRYVASRVKNRFFELSDLLLEAVETPTTGIWVFKSVGLGFQDLVCAEYLYEKFSGAPAAMQIDSFGGSRAY